MKLNPTDERSLLAEQAYNRTDTGLSDRVLRTPYDSNDRQGINRTRGDESSTRKVLNSNEKSMLHMMFGTEKPEEMTFYGRNKVHQIHKGQLLDVKG